MSDAHRPASPRRAEAGRRNRLLAGPLTEAGRQRLREAALRNRPWESSTGPRTPEGKARSADNGAARQCGERSVRATRAEVAALNELIAAMRATRQALR